MSRNRTICRAFCVGCLASLFIFLAGGCMVGPDYVQPQAPVQPEWMDPGGAGIDRGPAELTRWWQLLNDPVLDSLIERATRDNPSLHAAGARVLQAQAARAAAVGLLFPQQQDAFGDLSWNQASENRGSVDIGPSRALNRLGWLQDPAGNLIKRAIGGPAIHNVFHNWQFGLSVAWELDVWGRFRRGIEAADAALLASVATYDDVLVSLIAEVATNYVLLRTLEEQLAITRRNQEIQQRGYELAQTKFKGGTVTELDPAQAEALLRDTEAQIPGIEASIRQTKNTLCVLLGIPPQDISEMLGTDQSIPVPPATVAIGVPAELLRRRPDIRRAERILAAQSAQIGIATADLYPSFFLAGDIGYSAEHFPDLFRGNSLEAFAGPSFRWAVLNYGRIENNIRVQDAAFQSLISDYENAVLRAQGEVENSIAGLLAAQRQITSLTGSVTAASRAVEIAETQYRGGIADYTRVLNTQEFLITEQQRLVATQGAAAQSLITLYRGLGGGWEIREGQEWVPAVTREQMKKRTNWGGMLDATGVPQTQPSDDRPL